ncbi:MAG: 4-alpha-glucanotransferase [Candidatus Omnitrophica bacterium]|nr:4-alpha-glucanotransferase [Candidatus Omnitrophota bacterium]
MNSISKNKWKRIGLKRRAGVATPLFSIYSKKSVGIGEIPDLKLLVDWCKQTKMSIIQLLPLNDAGFEFVPYNAQSGFALDPMYLRLSDLEGVSTRSFRDEIELLRSTYGTRYGRDRFLSSSSKTNLSRNVPGTVTRVDYRIKAAKLELLWKVFQKNAAKIPSAFNRYVKRNHSWILDYALFKVIKEEQGGKKWEDWPQDLRERKKEALERFEREHRDQIRFQMWLQWQLFRQFKETRRYARSKKVLLMGDLPFLTARDSADVWSHPEYFKLDLSSGAPPDAYFFKGQRWGSPPCNWEKIAADSYDYLIGRLKCAERFYDLIRMDHVVGLFRLWSIPLSEPLENGGMNGFFDPRDESTWEEHGRKLLSTVIQNTKMLVCAEDLGTVPECSYRVLGEFAIPGTDVQRWIRVPENEYSFKLSENYRKNSIATISTHDTASFNAWWEYEAGTVYGPLFERTCKQKGISFEDIEPKLFDLGKSVHHRLRWRKEISSPEILSRVLNRAESEIWDLIDLYRYSFGEKSKFWNYLNLPGRFEEKSSPALAKAALEKISRTNSIFSIQLLQDWLALGKLFKEDSWETRINFPGISDENNWTLTVPVSLEELKKLDVNQIIKAINTAAKRS